MTERTNESDGEDRRAELCGRTLGDYRIERRVGGGATSDVFLATQMSLGRRVALKILKDELADDETYLKRFLQEARAAARLEHPNIVRVYEVGTLTDDESDGAPKSGSIFAIRRSSARRRGANAKTYRFIAQEFIDGMSLQQFLRRNGPATIPQTLATLEQIASALKRAAEAGVVHRDVKPENVLLDGAGTIKVVDFGLAWIENSLDSAAATALTRAGFALGTPLYMSPEQARGQKIDIRSDIYSLGVVAYRMLTGVAPFRGETPLSVVLKHLNETPRSISEFRADVPATLQATIRRSLAKNPNDRPESPDALLAELRIARREYEERVGQTIGEIGATGATGASLDVADRGSDSSGFDLNLSEGPNFAKNGDDSGRVDGQATFFQSDQEREGFERALATTKLSRAWQTNWLKLDETRAASDPFWTRRRITIGTLALIASFFLGGGALLAKNRLNAKPPVEPPSTIRRFDSVEEQWVFALQLGTVDAWKSVGEYFSNEEYWKVRAARQLALVYVDEKNVAEARSIFEDFAAKGAVGSDFNAFGLAGLAWCAAVENDFNAAVATISELRAARPREYDRLTEVVLAKTQEKIRGDWGKMNANVPNWPNFAAPFGPGQGGFGGQNPGQPSDRRSGQGEGSGGQRGGGRQAAPGAFDGRPNSNRPDSNGTNPNTVPFNFGRAASELNSNACDWDCELNSNACDWDCELNSNACDWDCELNSNACRRDANDERCEKERCGC